MELANAKWSKLIKGSNQSIETLGLKSSNYKIQQIKIKQLKFGGSKSRYYENQERSKLYLSLSFF
jgi:hypothetical protein